MSFSKTTLASLAASLLFFTQKVQASFDINSKENVALYWGQNSAGSQERLSYYCESDAADILLLSFMTEFSSADGAISLNFANACSSTFSDGLLDCTEIAADIATCQSLGKKVLLSLGGASGAYGFASDSDAEGFAETLWNTFGAGSADERPFGDSIVDGFDFDIENNNDVGYAALATSLRTYYAQDTSKDYYISAAPQCPYPDASIGDMLENADVDFAFIQFYNNYCSIAGTFNWDTWADYATSTSPNSNIKLFLGLPGAAAAAGSGYETVDAVSTALNDYIVNIADSNFGGIMLWDASQSFANEVSDDQNYAEAMKSLLTAAYGSATSTSTTSTKATTSSTSTTSTKATTTSTSTTSTKATTSSTSTKVTTSSTSTTSTKATTSSTSTEATTSTSSTVVVPTTTSTTPAAPVPTTTSTSTPAAPVTTSTTPVVVLTTSTKGEAVTNVNTLTTMTTILTSSTSSTTAASATTGASAGYTDCTGLSGTALAKCQNANFDAGLYLGSADSCETEGDMACTPQGTFAICNFGKWVDLGCAAGTECFAYTVGDDVDVGCNYPSLKSSFTKRDGGILEFFKRSTVGHRHHAH